MNSIIAIVGRPNVGKSTLYNRLIGERKAIVDNISGVTRDRQYGECEWNGKRFTVIDTGGFIQSSDDVFDKAIRSQVEIAMQEASHIIFMTDVTTGITDLDDDIAKLLRKSKKPVFLAVNKVDNHERLLLANEFWSLGIEDTFFLSSITGSGTGDLLDALTDLIEVEEDNLSEETDEEVPKFAIIGRPNVGKSSLTNALLGEERNIVTDIAGTTRDSIHSEYKKFGKHFKLIDTAGIRKKAKVHEDLEFYSVIRAVKAIDEADVCLLMIDATRGVESQDMSILDICLKRKKGIVFLINKWDLVPKETNTARDLEEQIKKKTAPFTDFPIVFISVLEKQRIAKTLDAAMEVFHNRRRKIKTSTLNEWLSEATDKLPPPLYRGRRIKLKYGTQLPLYYPAFAFFTNYPKEVKGPYRNYLENRLRESFNFTGVPLTIYFRDK